MLLFSVAVVGVAPLKTSTPASSTIVIAASLGVPAAQVALSWVHARAERWGISVVPIPGTKRVKYLESNVAARNLHLPKQVETELESLAGAVLGLRHPQFALTSAGGRA